MNLLEIQDDPVFADYLEEKVLKPRTVEIYSYHMKHYCEAIGMSPTDLLEEAEDEEEEVVPLRKTKLRQHLKTFEEFIKIKDFSKQHQQGAMTIIRNFYSFHDIRLPYAKPNKALKTHETIEDLPSKNDIAKALGHCNHKYKAIILTMVSSGMGSSEVRGLKVQNFLDSLSEYFNKPLELPLDIDQIRSKLSGNVIVPTFNIVRVKTSTSYSTFASPEAVNAIIDFLEKYPPKSPDNFLFPMSKRNIDKQITNNTFTLYFRRLNDTCNFDKVNRFRKFHSHALRKYFASTLINKDIKQWSIDAMLGHAVRNRTTGAYFKPDPKAIIGDYLKIVEDLSILEDVDIKHLETKEYKELKELKRAEKERKNEMEDMKNNLEKQNEALEGIKEFLLIKSPMDLKKGREILAKVGKDMSATELLDIIEERDKED